MKKYSDIFSGYTQRINQVGRQLATTALIMVAAITFGFAQDFIFIEGSVHGFQVDNHDGNTFAWSFHDETFNPMPNNTIDFMEGQFENKTTVRFMDMDRALGQMVHLAVTETGVNGCSTTRALKIMLEPNNMYLEFASANTEECFNMGDYDAPLKVGMNFKDKTAGVAIPEYLFPLKVSYQIRNVTDNSAIVAGNSGAPVEMAFSTTNDYSLLIPQTEVSGNLTRTTEYELTITSVTDKYDTEITNNSGDVRLQIRIINHLPQSGGMDMALAYTLTPINYMGAQ